MENTTIEQLDGAVSQLMEAYESLQAKYETLEEKNQDFLRTLWLFCISYYR